MGSKDVRYQLKTLESASVMDTEDFFAGDFTKQVKPDMLVKPQGQWVNKSARTDTPKGALPTDEDTDMTEEESVNAASK